jgi:hypothetical protein
VSTKYSGRLLPSSLEGATPIQRAFYGGKGAMNGLMHCNKRGGIGWLFNHLVGGGKQARRHREAERSSSLEVD